MSFTRARRRRLATATKLGFLRRTRAAEADQQTPPAGPDASSTTDRITDELAAIADMPTVYAHPDDAAKAAEISNEVGFPIKLSRYVPAGNLYVINPRYMRRPDTGPFTIGSDR